MFDTKLTAMMARLQQTRPDSTAVIVDVTRACRWNDISFSVSLEIACKNTYLMAEINEKGQADEK